METYLAFIGLSLLVITTPGPDTAVTIRSAMAASAGITALLDAGRAAAAELKIEQVALGV